MSAWSALTPEQRIFFQRVPFDEVAPKDATLDQALQLQADAFMHSCDFESAHRSASALAC